LSARRDRDGPDGAGPSPNRAHLLRSVAALAAVVCALALPFAPVLDEETTVRWSSAAAPATTALFVPYRAAELTAEVSCAAVRTISVAASAQRKCSASTLRAMATA